MIQWRSLSTDDRIAAIKSHWQDGSSAGDIASRIGVSRNVVIGMYARHKNKLADTPLLAPRPMNTAKVARVPRKSAAVASGPTSVPNRIHPTLLVPLRQRQLSATERAKLLAPRLAQATTERKFSDLTFSEPRRARGESIPSLPRLKRAPAGQMPALGEPRRVALVELGRGDCRWPVESEGTNHFFCGLPRREGFPYCPHHAHRAWLSEE